MPTTFGPNKNNPSYIDPFLSTNAPLGYKITCNNFPQGSIICRNGGTTWIVAPSSSEVTRSYNSGFTDAITQANACTSLTSSIGSAWFIPTLSQLQNPGFVCKANWDSFTTVEYWSTSTVGGGCRRTVDFATGSAGIRNVQCVLRLRVFKTITY